MITVEPYDPDWPRRIHEQKTLLQQALADRVVAIEHVGSTAIPGLPAKPIVELAALAGPVIDPFALDPYIEDLDYRQHRSGPKTHAVYTRGPAPSERRYFMSSRLSPGLPATSV